MRMSIALLSLVIFAYSAAAQDNSVLTYHGDAARSGNFIVPALTWEKARSVNLDRAFDAHVAGHLYAQPLYWRAAGSNTAMLQKLGRHFDPRTQNQHAALSEAI